MMIDGKYGTMNGSDESTSALPSALPTLSLGFSNDKADLMTIGHGEAGNGRFFVGGHLDAIKIVPGTNQFEFLVSAPPEVDPGNVFINIFGPAYDAGIRHFEQKYFTGSNVSILPVPEPTTWAMLLAGVGILGVARRRKTAA
ncbi:hypothetical protein DPH57_18770 [Massilia sp. YMA4]|nr:hypothetical protein DPH57_18770 [Massilia sp. YMA4]